MSDDEWQPPDLTLISEDHSELLVLKVAQEEIGYVEEKRGSRRYSKYGDWMGTPYSQWCAEFLTWCVNQADERYGTQLLYHVYPYYDNTGDGAPFFIEHNRFVSSNRIMPDGSGCRQWWPDTGEYLRTNEYIPSPGDYMWLYLPGYKNNPIDHVAIVEGVSVGEDGVIHIHVIEGNMPDRVQRAVYPIDDIRIYGFGTPEKIIMTEMHLHGTFDDVVTVRQRLQALGYTLDSYSSGYFDENLKKAVQKFQKANGLKPTGNVTKETWLVLEDQAGE